jgi:SAM-dependent methyltransferase
LTERAGLRFGRVAEEYERVRSGYPASLVDKACAGLEPQDRIVEIGPGTGKLTRELAARGLSVDAVEPDADLVAVARTTVPASSVRFHVDTFEQVDLPDGVFRAAFAATSYHWVDPDVGWRKVAALLEPGAVFALLSHVGGTRGQLDEEVTQVWRDVAGSTWEPLDDETLWAGVESRLGNISELWAWLTRHQLARPEAATLFRDVRLDREPVEQTLTLDDYLARVRTTNTYLHLAPEDQQRLEQGLTAVLEAHGGVYPASHFAVLVTARRV